LSGSVIRIVVGDVLVDGTETEALFNRTVDCLGDEGGVRVRRLDVGVNPVVRDVSIPRRPSARGSWGVGDGGLGGALAGGAPVASV